MRKLFFLVCPFLIICPFLSCNTTGSTQDKGLFPQDTLGNSETINFHLSGAPSYRSVVLTWNDVPYVIRYELVFSPLKDWSKQVITKSNIFSGQLVDNLNNGTRYYFFVRAYTSRGQIFISNVVSVIPWIQAPDLIAVTSGNHQTTIRWSSSKGATSYRLDWIEDTIQSQTSWHSINLQTLSYQQLSQNNFQFYRYRIWAIEDTFTSLNYSQAQSWPNTLSEWRSLGGISGMKYRDYYQTDTCNGYFWLFGGYNQEAFEYKELWRSQDMVHWSLIDTNSAVMLKAVYSAAKFYSFNGYLWVLPNLENRIYRSMDGKKWDTLTAPIKLRASSIPKVVAFQGKAWALQPEKNWGGQDTLWYGDGLTWYSIPMSGFPDGDSIYFPRLLSSKNILWIVCPNPHFGGPYDSWSSSNGTNWNHLGRFEAGENALLLYHEGYIWNLNEINAGILKFSIDGKTWFQTNVIPTITGNTPQCFSFNSHAWCLQEDVNGTLWNPGNMNIWESGD